MTLMNERQMRDEAAAYKTKTYARLRKSADELLNEVASTSQASFDVFLSHSFKDSDLVLGVYHFLSRSGLAVYVDWIVDKEMDRSAVTPATAETLRTRMRQCRSLIYAHSSSSGGSKWMSWELGYFDGYRSAVAILPIVKEGEKKFTGQEYLGLYPYIDATATIWVNQGHAPVRLFQPTPDGRSFKSLKSWLIERRD
jgi:hypothetical protein